MTLLTCPNIQIIAALSEWATGKFTPYQGHMLVTQGQWADKIEGLTSHLLCYEEKHPTVWSSLLSAQLKFLEEEEEEEEIKLELLDP